MQCAMATASTGLQSAMCGLSKTQQAGSSHLLLVWRPSSLKFARFGRGGLAGWDLELLTL